MAFFMTYLVDEVNGGIRASLPNFNLYTFASAVSEVPARLQEAVAAGYHGKEPKSSGLDELKDDPRYQGGWWLWLNIDVDDLPARRCQISLNTSGSECHPFVQKTVLFWTPADCCSKNYQDQSILTIFLSIFSVRQLMPIGLHTTHDDSFRIGRWPGVSFWATM